MTSSSKSIDLSIVIVCETTNAAKDFSIIFAALNGLQIAAVSPGEAVSVCLDCLPDIVVFSEEVQWILAVEIRRMLRGTPANQRCVFFVFNLAPILDDRRYFDKVFASIFSDARARFMVRKALAKRPFGAMIRTRR
jgi:hypothetical protein